jgi:acyl-CoA thioesterase FadM
MMVSHETINPGSGEVAATLEGVVVLFDLENRCAVTIPDDLRKTAQQHVKADFV